MKLMIALATSLLISVFSEPTQADCFKCRCVSKPSDGPPRFTAEVRVQLESECSVKCGLYGATCDISAGYCHPDYPQLGYRLTRLAEDKCISCGSYWTRWRDIGSPGLDPCPPGCSREPATGSQIGSDYRKIVRYTPLGPVIVSQEKNKFACYGTATGPAPVQDDEPVIPQSLPPSFSVGTPVPVPEPSIPARPPPPPRPDVVIKNIPAPPKPQDVRKRLGL